MMPSENETPSVVWVTTGEAATLTGYVVEYVRCLARKGRIHAEKRGRDWWVNRDALLHYKVQMDRLGEQKHNPWREKQDHYGGNQ
jgi:excisionase family DNA binding protein